MCFDLLERIADALMKADKLGEADIQQIIAPGSSL